MLCNSYCILLRSYVNHVHELSFLYPLGLALGEQLYRPVTVLMLSICSFSFLEMHPKNTIWCAYIITNAQVLKITLNREHQSVDSFVQTIQFEYIS